MAVHIVKSWKKEHVLLKYVYFTTHPYRRWNASILLSFNSIDPSQPFTKDNGSGWKPLLYVGSAIGNLRHFSYIRSPTFGPLDTASENIIHFTDSSRIEKCNNTLHKSNPITVTIYAVRNNFYLLKLEFEISDFCSKIVRHLNASLLTTNANDQVNQWF